MVNQGDTVKVTAERTAELKKRHVSERVPPGNGTVIATMQHMVLVQFPEGEEMTFEQKYLIHA